MLDSFELIFLVKENYDRDVVQDANIFTPYFAKNIGMLLNLEKNARGWSVDILAHHIEESGT